MARDGSNNIYLVCQEQQFDWDGPVSYVLRYNADGAKAWTNSLLPGEEPDFYCVEAIAVGGGLVATTGYAYPYDPNDARPGSSYSTCSKTDGARSWQTAADYAAWDRWATDVAISGGNVYVSGIENPPGSPERVVKYNSVGSTLWETTLSPSGGCAQYLSTDASGNAYVAGGSALSKLSATGIVQWTRTKQSPRVCEISDMALGPKGTLHVTGKVWTGDTSSRLTDYVTVKYAR